MTFKLIQTVSNYKLIDIDIIDMTGISCRALVSTPKVSGVGTGGEMWRAPPPGPRPLTGAREAPVLRCPRGAWEGFESTCRSGKIYFQVGTNEAVIFTRKFSSFPQNSSTISIPHI